jgi:eukaryotic-like serine/threonine-protein kinase
MPITDELILPSDVVFTPMGQPESPAAAGAGPAPCEYAVTRPGSRVPSSVIDAQAVEMLSLFRKQTTIADAVLTYSRLKQLDPQTVLDEAFPLLSHLWAHHLLVSADSEEAKRITPSVGYGQELAGYRVLTCLHVLEDTEVYEVETRIGERCVMKIARSGADGDDRRRRIAREAFILEHLGGLISPKLIEAGAVDERPFVLMELCPGVPVHIAAQQFRRSGHGRGELIKLCCDILDCYSQLHAREVVHADVHQKNVLAAADGTVRIVDFGIAHWQPASEMWGKPEPGGVAFFYTPEYAQALRCHRSPQTVNYLSEQYSIAVLIWYLLTGAYHVRFSIEANDMLRQIVEDSPEPFSYARGTRWPAVERVLRKALSKDASDRWNSITEFGLHLQRASKSSPTKARGVRSRNAFSQDVFNRLQVSKPLFREGIKSAPVSSVHMGAAGIAYAIYRRACIQSDASLLALADLWAMKAATESTGVDAFYNRELDLLPGTVGCISPYHTASGVYLVQALISRARGDLASVNRAVDAFLAASEPECESLDLTLGQSGTILGCSLLLECVQSTCPIVSARASDLAQKRVRSVWDRIAGFPPIIESQYFKCSGIAHGWAGLLYATLHWCGSSGMALPGSMESRLRELMDCAEPAGAGVRWKWETVKSSDNSSYMPGWCGGSAGFVFLWCLAHRVYGDAAYLAVAEKAARYCCDTPVSMGDLCCGAAGRAYSLLHLFKHTGETTWLHRAREQADLAVYAIQGKVEKPHSLYKGEVGVALLLGDLENPEGSCMPLFESEGWAVPKGAG